MIEDPFDGCFLCTPESWRVLWEGRYVRIIAGLGPITPGYVLLAPKEHLHTTAQLPDGVFHEFIVAGQILQLALAFHYRPGYTAWEHGQLGACRVLEAKNDFSTFCHHCHRVYIPHQTNCESKIEPWFSSSNTLADDHAIRQMTNKPYVFYESGVAGRQCRRSAYRQSETIPSQFMRRLLSSVLGTGRDYRWDAAPRYEELITTATVLRSSFIGLEQPTVTTESGELRPLPAPVTVDGLSGVGKTTLARAVSGRWRATVCDTGLLFRYLALCEARGDAPNDSTALAILTSSSAGYELRDPEILPRVRQIAGEDTNREMLRLLVCQVVEADSSTIVVGRDAWQLLRERAIHILVEADLETRVSRRCLQAAVDESAIVSRDTVRRELLAGDEVERGQLPSADDAGVIRLCNSHRSLDAVVGEVSSRISEEYDT